MPSFTRSSSEPSFRLTGQAATFSAKASPYGHCLPLSELKRHRERFEGVANVQVGQLEPSQDRSGRHCSVTQPCGEWPTCKEGHSSRALLSRREESMTAPGVRVLMLSCATRYRQMRAERTTRERSIEASPRGRSLPPAAASYTERRLAAERVQSSWRRQQQAAQMDRCGARTRPPYSKRRASVRHAGLQADGLRDGRGDHVITCVCSGEMYSKGPSLRNPARRPLHALPQTRGGVIRERGRKRPAPHGFHH